MSNLATIRRISEIKSIPDADFIVAYRIDGWWIVDSKDKYHVGDLVIYVEIDTWIPHALAPFLSKGTEPRTYEGVVGERLRTVKLRGQLSQGLLLPVSELDATQFGIEFFEGQDVTEILGVLKWHAPVPTALGGDVLPWPSELHKTDQENVQNIYDELQALANVRWIVEEKLDGSSCTIYRKPDGCAGICSRNWELKRNEANRNNAFVLAATRQRLFDAIESIPQRVAMQAELCGPGIQGNPYRLTEPKLFVFDIFLIEEERYATHGERMLVLNKSEHNIGIRFDRVPTVGVLDSLPTLDDLLRIANGTSLLNEKIAREGLVFKTRGLVDGRVRSFKVVSNKYLLKQR